jgi:hypothetical protein
MTAALAQAEAIGQSMSEDEEGAVEEKPKELTYDDVKDLSYAQSTARAVPQGLMSVGLMYNVQYKVRAINRDIGWNVVFTSGCCEREVIEDFVIACLHRNRKAYGQHPWFHQVKWPQVMGAAAREFYHSILSPEERWETAWKQSVETIIGFQIQESLPRRAFRQPRYNIAPTTRKKVFVSPVSRHTWAQSEQKLLPIPEVEDRAAEVTSPVLSVWV